MPRLTVNGLCLNVDSTGTGDPLVWLHGFTGSAATWKAHAEVFSRKFQVLAVDLHGHGLSDSPADPRRYSMEHCAEDLIAILDYFGHKRANLLGYSMGGRVALHFAINHPERVQSLILESASPGLEDPQARIERRTDDEFMAQRIEKEGLESFVEYWGNLPLFASQKRLPGEIREWVRFQRLQNDPRGLANSLRGLGTGTPEPLWDRLAGLDVPTLLIAGALDKKFTEIAKRMAALIPAAQLEIVPNVGHTVHLENSAGFDKLVLNFLEQVQGITK
jgi:2-succinyl-6-hydroxy-2,4-cyclohexadiene-1-carboxylate synthase